MVGEESSRRINEMVGEESSRRINEMVGEESSRRINVDSTEQIQFNLPGQIME